MPLERAPLRILLLTDVFPPGSGGSGWSTYYLGKALQDRSHSVRVLRPLYSERVARVERRVVEYGGLAVDELLIPEPPGWAVKLGIDKAVSERIAVRAMARSTYSAVIRGGADVLHGQHAVSAQAASKAAQQAQDKRVKVVSVATVRDYWPLCPNSTRIILDYAGDLCDCEDCHIFRTYLLFGQWTLFPGYARPRDLLWRARYSLLATRNTFKWLRTWHASRTLAQCDAVIAVSEYVRGELARSGRIPEGKLVSMPNLVDLPSVDRALDGAWPLHDISPTDPYLLYAGKLDVNKGALMLSEVIGASGVRLPLVLAGDGPLRAEVEAGARAWGLDFRFYDWLDNDAVIKLMRHTRALLFPSAWQEPLSRVLLEGCAAGAAIVALNTGGTSDVIKHGESGWLADDFYGFVEGVKQVTSDDGLNARLRKGARKTADDKFAAPKVSAEVERLYFRLLDDLNK